MRAMLEARTDEVAWMQSGRVLSGSVEVEHVHARKLVVGLTSKLSGRGCADVYE